MEIERNNTTPFLEFKLAKELFAIKIENVLEVFSKQEITPVPKSSDYVMGVINFRGNIIPVIDTFTKFNVNKPPSFNKSVIIILELTIENKIIKFGIIADKVLDVLDIENTDIYNLPEIGNSYNSEYLLGIIDDKFGYVILLDIVKIFSKEDVKVFKDNKDNHFADIEPVKISN